MNIDDAAEKWLHKLGTLYNKSDNTVKTYRVGLGHLLRYLKAAGKIDTSKIVPGDVTDCAELLAEVEGIEHRTKVAYATTMNQWLKWLALEELVVLDVTPWQRLQTELEEMRKGDTKERRPRLPDENDVQAALAAAQAAHGNTPRKELIALRDRAIAETLRSTGARVSEVASMKRSTLREQTATVRGKGDKTRKLYFDDRAWDAVTTYLAERDRAGLIPGEREPVFARHDRRASHRILSLSTNSFRRVVDKLCKMGGAEHITPHQFRHRFGTRVLRDTELARAQELLGHASPETTRVYAKLDDEQLRQAHRDTDL